MLLGPTFSGDRDRDTGHPHPLILLSGGCRGRPHSLDDAVAALQVYSDRYGPYPSRDMAIVEAPLTFHGMEFPGLSLIGSQVYNQYRKDLETLVVHEVAHQWWYNQVGSDQIMNPWLDEGLAEFSMYDYFAGRYGEPAAERLRELAGSSR